MQFQQSRFSLVWASFAGLFQIILAIGAGAIAYWQVTEQWAAQNEQAARNAYRDFLKVSMENPTLSGGDFGDFQHTDIESEKYFWYATLMTETFEQVLAHVPNIESWIDLVKVQVDMHCTFYNSGDFVAELYSLELQNIVEGVISEIEC